MPSKDSDDRLLDALRGHPVGPTDGHDADKLHAAERIGAAARAEAERDQPGAEVPADLWPSLRAELVAETLDEAEQDAVEIPARADAPVLALRRRPHMAPWLAAAAVVAVIAGVAAWWQTRDAEPTTIAAVELEPLTGQGEATAELIDDGDNLFLEVELAGVDPDDGYLEVWLLDAEVTRLFSLGPARPDGRYDIPAGLDPNDLPVVDVSVEPFDGSPAHSGNSVFRGALEL